MPRNDLSPLNYTPYVPVNDIVMINSEVSDHTDITPNHTTSTSVSHQVTIYLDVLFDDTVIFSSEASVPLIT